MQINYNKGKGLTSKVSLWNSKNIIMKKALPPLVIFLLSLIAFNGFSQTAVPTDFFAGKWEISIPGTPNGDVKFVTDLVRKDGKLTGELVNTADPSQPKRHITKVEEKENNIIIYFESDQVSEISMNLTKVDADNLKGTVYNFEATAKRIKG